jgi:cellulose synthase/poly-beta-1,6-N-acetylglucosamine synthase-like glycosyltransferase
LETLTLSLSRPAFGRRPERDKAQPVLTIIVPVYNEVGTIDELLRRVLETKTGEIHGGNPKRRQVAALQNPARHAGPTWNSTQQPTDVDGRRTNGMQVIVVDDGSADGTGEKLEAWKGRVSVVTHAVNRGKGASIRTGLALARGEFTIIQDADLEYDPRDYQRLLEPLLAGEADVVYGSRYLSKSQIPQVAEANQSGDESPHSKSWSMCRLGVMTVGWDFVSPKCRSAITRGRSPKGRKSVGATGGRRLTRCGVGESGRFQV